MDYSKVHIEILILVFMFTTFSLSILFSLYYISPSNYILYDFTSSNKKTLTKEYVIEPHKQKIIKDTKYPDKVLRIYSNDEELISITLENKFKSENIYVSKNNLIKIVNSNLVIKNTFSKTLNVIVEVYSGI